MDNDIINDKEGTAASKKTRPSKTEKTVKKESVTFEAAMTRLEAVVRALEDGKTSLEESMKLYEEGVALVRLCSGKLEEAERRVNILTGSES